MALVQKELKNAYIGELPIPTTYTPNENTLLYIPMKKDLLDYSGKDVVINNNNLATVDTSILSSWMWVWNFSSWPLTIDIWALSVPCPLTISFWVCIPNFVYRSNYGFFNIWNWANMSYWPSGPYNDTFSMMGKTYSTYGYDGTWNNFVIRWDWWPMYLRNQKDGSSQWQYISGSTWPTTSVSNICSLVWYMSDFILEGSYWSDAQCTEYYNNSSQYYL